MKRAKTVKYMLGVKAETGQGTEQFNLVTGEWGGNTQTQDATQDIVTPQDTDRTVAGTASDLGTGTVGSAVPIPESSAVPIFTSSVPIPGSAKRAYVANNRNIGGDFLDVMKVNIELDREARLQNMDRDREERKQTLERESKEREERRAKEEKKEKNRPRAPFASIDRGRPVEFPFWVSLSSLIRPVFVSNV